MSESYFIWWVKPETGLPFVPAYIEVGDLFWEAQVKCAVGYFGRIYSDCEVTTYIEQTPWVPGIFEPGLTPTWWQYAQRLNAEFLDGLAAEGVSERVRSIVREDLLVERNLEMLIETSDANFTCPEDRHLVRRALEIALDAHFGQTQARLQDEDGLFHIPYANHPVRTALLALNCPDPSPELVQAALLHDVVEDTEYSFEDLAREFPERVVDLVRDVTRGPGESRGEFIRRAAGLGGDSKLIKCLDRFQNMIRAICLRDPAYHARLLKENQVAYDDAFRNSPRLAHLAPSYRDLAAEVRRLVCRSRTYG